MAAFYWERHPSGPFVTLIAVAATYCSPEASPDGYERLRRLARRDDDHEMREFKAELRQALDATVSGLPGDVRAEQISFWREDIAEGLIADGIKPEDAEREASLVEATFTGLLLDLLATDHRKRLTDALECALSRLDDLRQTAPVTASRRPRESRPGDAN